MEKRLIRKMPGKMIGGVAAGLAEYLDIDATIVRLLFVLATFFHGSGLLIYIVLWIAMPAGPQAGTYSGQAGAANPDAGISPDASSSPGAARPAGSESSGNRSAAVIGWILVGLGIFFLMDEFLEPWFRDFFYWFNFRRIWPVVFIIVGVLIISSATKKEAARSAGNADDSGDAEPSTTPGSPAGLGSPGAAGSGPLAERSLSAPEKGPSDAEKNPSAPEKGPSDAEKGPSAPEGSGSALENNPPASPDEPSAPGRKPRRPGEGPLNNPGNDDKF